MHERYKLSEAQYFYSKMIKENATRENFCYEMSAFLVAARSVLQHALEEAKNKHGGQKWYDTIVSKSIILSFFKNKRDFNIHEGLISLRTDCTVMIGEEIGIHDSISVVLQDKDGNVIGKFDTSGSPPETDKPKPTVIGKYQHFFDDWKGKEDILELCKIYINELELLISDGISNKFITG